MAMSAAQDAMDLMTQALLDGGYEGDPSYDDYQNRPPPPASPTRMADAAIAAAAGDHWAQEYCYLAIQFNGLRNAYGIALRQRSELAESLDKPTDAA